MNTSHKQTMSSSSSSSFATTDEKEQVTSALSFSDPVDLGQRIAEAGNMVTDDVILCYFAQSPFFDTLSRNQELLAQNMTTNLTKTLSEQTGLMFVIDAELSRPTRLFVIQKLRVHALRPARKQQLLDVFFCLDSVIMRAPQLLELIRTRFGKTAMHLERSFDALFFPAHTTTAQSATENKSNDDMEIEKANNNFQETSIEQGCGNDEMDCTS